MNAVQRETSLGIIAQLRDPKLAHKARIELLSFLERIITSAGTKPDPALLRTGGKGK